MAKQKKLATTEALKVSKRIIGNGAVIPTAHFRDRMKDRAFAMQDALRVVRSGKISGEPEQHPKSGRWNYKIEGTLLDERKLIVVVDIIEEENRLVFMTGMTE